MKISPSQAAAHESDYAFARSRLGSPPRTTLLHIGEHDTVVLTGSGAGPDATLTLALGSRRTAAAFFRHDPPTPLELETAIETVEVEVSRVRGLPIDGAVLASSDIAVRELDTIGAPPGSGVQVMALATVESLFQRLASASLGHPSALKGMPGGREAAAVLLILREFMHHLGFEAISVIDGPEDWPGLDADSTTRT